MKKKIWLLLTFGCSFWRESRKFTKFGLPKWVMERKPVNKDLSDIFWKWRSQIYCKKTKNVESFTYDVLKKVVFSLI